MEMGSHVSPPKWNYYPPNAKLGLVMGGTANIFEPGTFGELTSTLMLKYAKKFGYAAYIEKDLAKYSKREFSWDKIPLLQKLLEEIEYVAWMDPDIILKNFDIPLYDRIMGTGYGNASSLRDAESFNFSCNGGRQKEKWGQYLDSKPSNQTFLWMSEDIEPNYLLNVNAGLMVIRRGDLARKFLQRVWDIGENPNNFKHHDPLWTKKKRTSPYLGWPWEEGAIWDALAKDRDLYLRRTCIAPLGMLQSVSKKSFKKGDFALHCTGCSSEDRWHKAKEMMDTLMNTTIH